jgi:hypothetical protein
MEQTIIAFLQTLLENPVTGPAILGAVRSVTGYLQLKWKEGTGTDFDKKTFGATILKYEVAINALAAILPADFKYIGAVVLVADILGSFGRKLLGK